ncbi:MAG: HD domain-containing protein [Pseudomonadales bacterium]|nr:HD domain-containing protein [Pseudomonadales bacterium]
MTKDLTAITHFISELDALKHVNRRAYLLGGKRVENSAEHSWHLAMVCWSISKSFNLDISEEKLIKLALVHDLGEIDAGDTFLYSSKRDSAHTAERKCIKRLEQHEGNGIDDLSALWEEQETGNSKEARLLKAVDRLLPFLHNLSSGGKAWLEHGIKQSQVVKAHAFILKDFPEMHTWMREKIEMATQKGWLINA